MKTLAEVLNLAKNHPGKTVAVACPEEHEIMAAVFEARRKNLCRFLLFGDKTEIERISDSLQEKPDEGIVITDIRDKTLAAKEAVRAVKDKKADIVMKGMLETPVIMKEVLNSESGLRKEGILSHIMVIELEKPDRLLFLTDGGLIIEPTTEQMKEITKNAVALAHSLQIAIPKVALLSASETVNPKMPTTIKCAQVREMFEKEENPRCLVEGPLALDIALDPNAARIKHIENPVAGKADILVVPYLEIANILYKGWMFVGNGFRSAGIVVGAKAPIVLTSRSDSFESKLYSLALAIVSERAGSLL